MSIPEEYGGQGQDVVTELIVTEVLGMYGYPALAAGHQPGCAVMNYWGSEEIKQKYLVPCAPKARRFAVVPQLTCRFLQYDRMGISPPRRRR